MMMWKSSVLLLALLVVPFAFAETTQLVYQDTVEFTNYNNGTMLWQFQGYNWTFTNTTGSFTQTINPVANVTIGNDTNCRDMKNTCEAAMLNLSRSCDGITGALNSSLKYYPMYTECYTNLSITSRAAADRDVYKKSSEDCMTAKQSLDVNYAKCSNDLSTCTNDKTTCKTNLDADSSNKYWWAGLAAAAGALLMWYFKVKPKEGTGVSARAFQAPTPP